MSAIGSLLPTVRCSICHGRGYYHTHPAIAGYWYNTATCPCQATKLVRKETERILVQHADDRKTDESQ